VTLKIKTLQDAKQACLNGSVRGLAWQGWERSLGPTPAMISGCALNGLNGRHCAIGWLIPPRKFNPQIAGANGVLNEGLLPTPIMKWFRLQPKEEQGIFRLFCVDLMMNHDLSGSPHEMHSAFRKMAESHKLTWPKGVQ